MVLHQAQVAQVEQALAVTAATELMPQVALAAKALVLASKLEAALTTTAKIT